MFSEIDVCSGITEELEMADTLSNTPLVQTEVGSKQNACDVFEKENEDEIAFSSDDIKLSTGYLNIKDCNEYKDEGAIYSEGNSIETDTGNKHLSQTILSYLYISMVFQYGNDYYSLLYNQYSRNYKAILSKGSCNGNKG